MKLFKLLFIIIFWMPNLGCKSQTSISRIEIVQPTIELEASSIWRTINDISFFEKQGYSIHLPKDSIIDSLILKSKNGAFTNEDYPIIYELVENKMFDQNNYLQALKKVKNELEIINHLINKIDSTKNQWDWDFRIFNTYKVIFTLYGTGGSYDPDNGTITLLTNKDGGFMNYTNPTNTIIHEITHMGMENSIVRKYNLSHGLKERIVDTFVYLMFKEKLPEYTIQNMGDKKIDKYLSKLENIDSLNAIISKFKNR